MEPSDVPTATEDCQPVALARCCKDLGIASELWDRRWVGLFKKKHCSVIWVENQETGKKRFIWQKKGASLEYPYQPFLQVPPPEPQT